VCKITNDPCTIANQDLCYAALQFASENLRPGGHFVCKFYQGAEDKPFQKKLSKMFETVKREKPESSRQVRTNIHLRL
jgi:21S rRNA (uridine2791-2'-O)-methyltransferase